MSENFFEMPTKSNEEEKEEEQQTGLPARDLTNRKDANEELQGQKSELRKKLVGELQEAAEAGDMGRAAKIKRQIERIEKSIPYADAA